MDHQLDTNSEVSEEPSTPPTPPWKARSFNPVTTVPVSSMAVEEMYPDLYMSSDSDNDSGGVAVTIPEPPVSNYKPPYVTAIIEDEDLDLADDPLEGLVAERVLMLTPEEATLAEEAARLYGSNWYAMIDWSGLSKVKKASSDAMSTSDSPTEALSSAPGAI